MGRKLSFERLGRLYDSFPALTILYARRYLADQPNHVPACVMLGMALIDMARYEEAEQALTKAIRLCPPRKRQIPLAQMGHPFRETGDYEQAITWYRKAIKADPGDASYYIFLGAALAKQGRFREAEKAHRAATECSAGCVDEAYLNLGFVLRAQERFLEAADSFREAIRLNPNYRKARRALRDVERCAKWAGDGA